MNAIQISYEEARERMRPGDVIAFSGKANISELIKSVTMSDVSHVGVILQTKVLNDKTGRFFNEIIESTTGNGVFGVTTSKMRKCLDLYEGEVWWLPLDEKIRATRFNEREFYDFLFNQKGKYYDTPQAVKSALDLLDSLPFDINGPTLNKEDFSKFFCSELVAAAFERAGVTGPINASEVTPIDLCRWRIYQSSYYQLKGDPQKRISRFNTASPADWNVSGQQDFDDDSRAVDAGTALVFQEK
ncbi:MAG: hypothetical protein ACTFAL_12375 [Candidatus Electronema sp. V4]|uniref:hypothetical protein n=1 Tax=Candidatus Electronema sp. V4 TaxID=3454756 RepID=UPI0040557557